jgi:formylglycine-generating enzyme
MQPASYTDPDTNMELLFVQGGEFEMGDLFGDGFENEQPVHTVEVDDFYLGKYLISQAQWLQVTQNNPSFFRNKGETCPVEMVSWHDVQEFIVQLNKKSDRTYRLPTEAEWEYAARSGGKREKWAGTSLQESAPDFGWFDRNSDITGNAADISTSPVGQKKPNGLGFYDMSGNVWEWTQDAYVHDAYLRHSTRNPVTEGSTDDDRTLRGGSWYAYLSLMRCSDRSGHGPAYRDRYVGFRLVMEP